MNLRNIITIISFLCFSLCKAQKSDFQKLDKFITNLAEENRVMGSFSIFENENEVYSRFIGYSYIETEKPIDPETRFRIGSVSKIYTATIIMQLIEQGKLSLDSKLSEFFPQIPKADSITIQNLLQHTSGLFNLLKDPEYLNYRANEISKEDRLAKISSFELVFEPGKHQDYSNTNYLLLSFIAENISNESFSDVLDARITEPLELTTTGQGKVIDPSENEALSYHPADANWIEMPETHPSLSIGAGSMFSTPREMNVFIQSLFNATLVDSSSLNKMREIHGKYGLGLQKLEMAGITLWGHSGGIDGFKSVLYYNPESGRSYAISLNASKFSLTEILTTILFIENDLDYEIPHFNLNAVQNEKEINELVGVYKNEELGLKFKFVLKDSTFIGLDSEGNELVFYPIARNKFRMGLSAITIQFDQVNNSVLLDSGNGKNIELKKLLD